ncbi:MAG: alkaline phosphatase [Planctomycetota bacterium]|nr:MAG: alkaline phosphatase [Planctomycetota bacterium]
MSFRRLAQAEKLLAGRREFILSGASLLALPWLGSIAQGAVKRHASFASDPFTLGVASGEPTPDGMVLWTRLAPEPTSGGGMPAETYEVTWELASDDAMKNVVQRGVALATPQLGHSVHVEVQGLQPDRPYWYRFAAGDAQTPVARTRTAPAHDALPDRLRFAFASCQKYEAGLFTAYEHLAAEDLDLVLHLGDYIYEKAGRDNQVRKHVGPETVTLEHYRNRYGQYKSDPLLQAAHARCPWLVVWDDHEVDNNYADAASEEEGVSAEDFLLRRAAAYQAYYESMPLRRKSLPAGPHMQLYRGVRYGRLLDFAMLDTRQYRTDQPNGDGRQRLTGAVLDPKGTILGDKQEHWLMRRMLASQSQWNVLGQQVIMARIDFKAGPGVECSMDKWSGYDVATKRLLKFIADRKIPNPVVLTGDIHTNWVTELKLDFDRPEQDTVATEFVGTSISSDGNGQRAPDYLDSLLAENPHVKFHNRERGYVSCTVTPDEWRSDYQVVEYVDRPGAPLITRKSFVVENGKPGAQPV